MVVVDSPERGEVVVVDSPEREGGVLGNAVISKKILRTHKIYLGDA